MIRAGIKWMLLILGTIIGAGYASGRELWQFFGDQSTLAIFLFTIIFTICIYVILKISYEHKTRHFIPVLTTLIGPKLTAIYDVVIILYLFSTTIVMIAGGATTLELFNIPYWGGVGFFCFTLVILFIWDARGLISLNALILPFLIIGLLTALGLFIFSNGHELAINIHAQANWPAAFTFTALNILPLLAVLGALGKDMKGMGEVWIASIGSGITFGVISFIYNEALLQISDKINFYEIPLFAILEEFPGYLLVMMSVLLWFAIYTTAASGVFGIITRFREKVSTPLWMLAVLTLVLMIPFTQFGFSTLIRILYPLYGIANLYILAALLLYPITNRYNIE